MIYLYRSFYFILKHCLLLFKPFLSKKTKKWIDLRSLKLQFNSNLSNAIWFHASSGEIEYCKSVINELKILQPEKKIVLSYSSPSAEKLLFNIQDKVDLIFPIPWDSPTDLQSLFALIKPSALVFSRTDFWPELIFQAHQKSVSLMAISMYPSLNFISRLSYRYLLKYFVFISTVDQLKSKQLANILKKNIHTFPDTRFDQVFLRLDQPSRILINSSGQTRRIVFASTWPEDEKYIFPLISDLLKQNFEIILAPHDISRSTQLHTFLKEFNPRLLSQYQNLLSIHLESPLLIIDQVGYLADIYRSADLVFVGGSFKKRIHSVMEPLSAQSAVFFGPHYSNNPEAIETYKLGITQVVHSTEEIRLMIDSHHPLQLADKKKLVIDYTQKQRGASRLIAEMILNHILLNHIED